MFISTPGPRRNRAPRCQPSNHKKVPSDTPDFKSRRWRLGTIVENAEGNPVPWATGKKTLHVYLFMCIRTFTRVLRWYQQQLRKDQSGLPAQKRTDTVPSSVSANARAQTVWHSDGSPSRPNCKKCGMDWPLAKSAAVQFLLLRRSS